MAKNKNLNYAAKAKNDEFYTQKSDIENELKHYKEFFRDKVIFCNCDDPYESEFFKYFAKRFNSLGLKRLIATCYDGSPIVGNEIPLLKYPTDKTAFKVEINEVQDWNGDGRKDLLDVEYIIQHGQNVLTPLEGNGDFRSAECVELLKQADIVVTNPPFSLFREYVAQLMAYDKKFIIIGNKNAITYKEIFPLIKDNKMWIGYTPMSKDILFVVPEKLQTEILATSNKGSRYRVIDEKFFARSQAIWFTNLDVKKRHEDLPLVYSYEEEPEKYPHYDNYDAIEVSKTADIPFDYDGVMGVPITFLDKYNPAQFEIVGHTSSADLSPAVEALRTDPKFRNRGIIDGKQKYDRILIRRR